MVHHRKLASLSLAECWAPLSFHSPLVGQEHDSQDYDNLQYIHMYIYYFVIIIINYHHYMIIIVIIITMNDVVYIYILCDNR